MAACLRRRIIVPLIPSDESRYTAVVQHIDMRAASFMHSLLPVDVDVSICGYV